METRGQRRSGYRIAFRRIIDYPSLYSCRQDNLDHSPLHPLHHRRREHPSITLSFHSSHKSKPMASSASITRALNAILPQIASGQPYEAHQKARTFASRYSKSGQFDTAIQVLFQSARELFKVGQQGSGTDLTTFLLDVYENKGEEINEESRGTVLSLSTFYASCG